MCMQAFKNVTTRVIGSARRNKHKIKDQYLWVSIKIYRTGSIPGVYGPTIFLVEVKNKNANYTNKLLIDNGVDRVSTVLIMPMVFMTEEAWVAENPPVFCGLSISDPILEDNP